MDYVERHFGSDDALGILTHVVNNDGSEGPGLTLDELNAQHPDNREDACLIRRDHGPHNMATLRRIAQNQIKLDASKGSQKTKRKRMGWSDDYLQGLFGLTPGSVSHAQTSSDG